MQYVDSAGRFCSKHEAYENGIIKDGYSIRVPMILVDSGIEVNLADSERAFANSPEGRAIIARAEMIHEMQGTGNNGRLPFGPSDAARVIKAAAADRKLQADCQAQWKREAEKAEGARLAAWHLYVESMGAPRR